MKRFAITFSSVLMWLITVNAFAAMGDGNEAREAQQYRADIQRYEAHLTEHPDDGATMLLLADAYEKAWWRGRAAQWLDQFLSKFPNDPQTEAVKARAAEDHRWVGAHDYIVGSPSKWALDELNKALALNPQLPSTYVWLSTVYRNEGMIAESIMILDKGLAAIPNEPTLLGMRQEADHVSYRRQLAYLFYRHGVLLYESNHPVAALSKFRISAALAPEFASAHLMTARLLFERGLLKQSIPEWRMAIQIRPSDKQAQFYLDLAEDFLQQGKNYRLAGR